MTIAFMKGVLKKFFFVCFAILFKYIHLVYIFLLTAERTSLTLFPFVGAIFASFHSYSFWAWFCSESEQPKGNRVHQDVSFIIFIGNGNQTFLLTFLGLEFRLSIKSLELIFLFSNFNLEISSFILEYFNGDFRFLRFDISFFFTNDGNFFTTVLNLLKIGGVFGLNVGISFFATKL